MTNDPRLVGTGPPRAGAHRRRALALGAAALCLAAPASDALSSSPGMQMRRARFALERGADEAAEIELDAVRRAEPGSARGLEAAMMLADLRYSSGRADEAAEILAEAARAAPDETVAAIELARGWLSLARGDADAARAGFDRVPAASGSLTVAVAEIGRAWASLAGGEGASEASSLAAVVRGDGPVALRFAAGFTLARVHAAAGEASRGLRELRRVRRLVRGSPYEDDLELALGLAQLDAGQARRARRTFERLQRRFGDGYTQSALAAGLDLRDLRAPSADLVGRVARLYADRPSRSLRVLPFLAALLDRAAGRDAAEARALAERALAAGKEGAR